MDKKAVEQARERLTRAEAVLDDIDELQDTFVYEKFEQSWSTFLLAANSIYSKLEQGSKVNGESRGWFGRVKHERRTDPLLSYIHHARNADEHGLQDFTKRRGVDAVSTNPKVTVNRDAEGNFTGWTMPNDLQIGESVVQLIKSHSDLATVRDDRFGDNFDPPTEHLGQPLADQRPSTVARLAFAYLSELITVAAALSEDAR